MEKRTVRRRKFLRTFLESEILKKEVKKKREI